ncbi:MAG: hypothetical protein QXM27_00950 [Candidatus Pacearchaeota archaeon]
MKNKNIAIIFVDAGLGHRRDAYNLFISLRKNKYKVYLINVFDSDIVGKFYSNIWNFVKKVYEYSQRKMVLKEITKFPLLYFLMELYSFLISKKLIEFIKKKKIKILISTHPLPLIDLSYKKNLKIKLINLIPDSIDYFSLWFYLLPGKNVFYFVNDRYSKEVLVRSGVSKERIFVTGHVLPIEETEKSLAKIKKRIRNIKNGNYLLFVTTGGAGTNKLEIKQIISEYCKLKKGKLIINCNHHDWLFRELIGKRKIINKKEINDGVFVIGYTYTVKFSNLNIDFLVAIGENENEKRENSIKIFNKFFYKADIIFTKPSELAFYSCGIPFVFFSPTNIVERRNFKVIPYAIKFNGLINSIEEIKKEIESGNLYLAPYFFGTKKIIRIIKNMLK